jgi:hypothetical protein
MKGFMRKTLSAFLLVGGISAIGCVSGGGARYRNLVDPCQFERYSSTARQEAISAFAPQVVNGHVLDQTIWNYHFESGTDKLHPGGMEKLDQLVRRRPEPDTRIFLATARDVGYNVANPEKYAEDQGQLNSKRAQAIQKYLAAQTATRPLNFEILVHDPSDPGISAVSARIAILGQRTNYSGGLTGSGGGSISGQIGGGGGVGAGAQQGMAGGQGQPQGTQQGSSGAGRGY